MKNKILLLILFIALIFVIFFPNKTLNQDIEGGQSTVNIEDNQETQEGIEETVVTNTASEPEETVILSEKILKVPFADQAPFKNWGDPYQESCEETSLIMANAFLQGNEDSDLDKNYIDEQILSMVQWQVENWGGHYDLDAQMTLELFQNYFSQNGQVVTISSCDEIKQYISQGNIIIAPTYGKLLENSHFTPPGPVYHMLLIKGYDENNFITNDPGIWQGKDFIYSYENLFKAIHDLPQTAIKKSGYIKENEEEMTTGSKNVILINQDQIDIR